MSLLVVLDLGFDFFEWNFLTIFTSFEKIVNELLFVNIKNVFVLFVVLETACAFWQALLSGTGNTFRSDWSFKRLA